MNRRPDEKSVNVRIRGNVQGVWFRAWTIEQAKMRDIRGWVRNRRDGSVEAVFCGAGAKVDELIGACWRGPSAAAVESIEVTPAGSVQRAEFISLPTE